MNKLVFIGVLQKLERLIKSALELFCLYFIRRSNKVKILSQRHINGSDFNGVICVTEWVGYEDVRRKRVCSHEIQVGTRDIIKSLENVSSSDYLKVLILTSDNFDCTFDLERYVDHFHVILLTSNVGQDIGAYKCAIEYLSNLKVPMDKPVVLMNSSVILKSIERFVSLMKIASSANCLMGIGMGYGPRNAIIKRFHLQSYFLTTRLCNFAQIFQNIEVPYVEKLNIIKYGEVAISQESLKLGVPLVCSTNGEFFISENEDLSLFSSDVRKNIELSEVNTI